MLSRLRLNWRSQHENHSSAGRPPCRAPERPLPLNSGPSTLNLLRPGQPDAAGSARTDDEVARPGTTADRDQLASFYDQRTWLLLPDWQPAVHGSEWRCDYRFRLRCQY